MNAAYQRYLTDEAFRARVLAAASRSRAQAIVGFFSRIFTFNFSGRKAADAARAHLARQR